MSEKVIAIKETKINPRVKKLIRQLKFARIIDVIWICDERSPRIVDQLSKYSEEAAPALPILYKLARKRSYYRLKEKAIRAIGKIGCSESKGFLIEILKKRKNQSDRHAAIQALRNFKKKELKEYIPFFKEITLNKKENPSVRHQALVILAVILEEPNDFLISFISPEKDDVLELTAVEYIGRHRVDEALPILRENIKSLEKNFEIIEYLFAIARIERDILGYGITRLEMIEEKGLLDHIFYQREFRSLYHSIRSEQAEKYPFDFEAYIDLLIEKWENQTVEFKSSLYYCPFKKERSSDLFYKFVQSVAAFANTNDGILIVGVDDKKNVIGIKSDLKYWGVDDNPKDKYFNEFTNQLIRYLKTNNLDFIKHEFIKYKNEEIFYVTVNRPDEYIYINGNEFYKRVNDSDRRLKDKDLANYIESDTQKRMNK